MSNVADLARSGPKNVRRLIRDVGLLQASRRIILWLLASLPPFQQLMMHLAAYRLSQQVSSCERPIQLVDVAYAFDSFGVRLSPLQIKSEIVGLLEVIRKLTPKRVLEIGTANGGTLFLFLSVLPTDSVAIGIDLPGGRFGGGYPSARATLFKSFRRRTVKMALIRANSHDRKTLAQVKAVLGGEPLDFLFIDGDHTYEGVKRDFEMYGPLVSAGGIIAFHDIVLHPPETGCEVRRFWNEVKGRYRYREIVEDERQNWAGIGILFVQAADTELL